MNTITRVLLVLSLVSLCSYMYGLWVTIINLEENSCKMTYMYEFPQFVKIKVEENDNYPKYNLYAYSEGRLTERTRNMEFNGAPVLFLPGNGGSYKQGRSFASVALRKGLDNNWIQHLDYYTIDFNGELTGLFGGTLETQTEFAAHCVRAILDLYKHLPNRPQSVVVIGHSMGGKIAQALLVSNVTDSINTVITLAAPLDKPVFNLDLYTHLFYNNIENKWNQKREVMRVITNETNKCCQNYEREIRTNTDSDKYPLNDKLMISIGSGSRDVLVHPELTQSKYSDIHAMTTSINNVWVSTDHLAAVWCLQLVFVVNRFLFSMIDSRNYKNRQTSSKGQQFIEDKAIKLAKAHHYFNNVPNKKSDLVTLVVNNNDIGDWVEDSRRVFTERFLSGVERTRIQMIRLHDSNLHKFLKVDIINLETNDWIFGCNANEISNNSRYCSVATSLTHYGVKQPSLRQDRHSLMINLHDIKKKHPEWSHVLIRILPNKKSVRMNIDVHNPSDRELQVSMPTWYSTSKILVLDETLIGSSYYNLKISDMEETHQALELTLIPRSCSKNVHHTVAKICVPWTDGFDRYHYFTENSSKPMHIYTPIRQPPGYNATQHKINVELHLDPNCRYEISVKNSISVTLSRIVQQYSFWLPAHLVTVLLLGFRYQISLTPSDKEFKCAGLQSSLLKGSPFFIITASRFFVKFVLFFKDGPQPEAYDFPIFILIVIHGSAIALLYLTTAALWTAICFGGNVAHKFLMKLINLRIPTFSSVILYVIQKFPTIAGVVLISIAMSACGGLALICACLIYFIILTNMYEDYLESFIFDTAKLIASKLFGKKAEEKPEEVANAEEVKEDENKPELEEPVDKEIAAIDQLLKEEIAQQTKSKAPEDPLRVEYEAIPEGLSTINFHLSLFLLLILLTLLNLPSVVTWARNYTYSKVLRPDPGQTISLVVVTCLCVLWQIPTPRKLMGYKIISGILYIVAVISLLYCQESVYRLNYIIAGIFVMITLHQLAAPKEKLKALVPENAAGPSSDVLAINPNSKKDN